MKVSVYIATTVDGFMARENGGLDWLPGSDGIVDPELGNEDFGFRAFMDSVDALVMGRNTYELVISSGQWPYGDVKVVVLSNSLQRLSDVVPDTVQLKSCSPLKLYQELADAGINHLYVDGGKTIQSFIAAGLINEITITKIPVLIASGIPLFGGISKDIKLRHLITNSYRNGFVQTTYEIVSDFSTC